MPRVEPSCDGPLSGGPLFSFGVVRAESCAHTARPSSVNAALPVPSSLSVVALRPAASSCVSTRRSVLIGNCVRFAIFGSDQVLPDGSVAASCSVASVATSAGSSGASSDSEVIGSDS